MINKEDIVYRLNVAATHMCEGSVYYAECPRDDLVDASNEIIKLRHLLATVGILTETDHKPRSIDAMKTFDEYRGFSYEQASREAIELIRVAAETQIWSELPERLNCLRSIFATPRTNSEIAVSIAKECHHGHWCKIAHEIEAALNEKDKSK